jgi:hypothetical protein
MKCIHCRKVLGKYGAYYVRGQSWPLCRRHWQWMTGRRSLAEWLESGEVGR